LTENCTNTEVVVFVGVLTCVTLLYNIIYFYNDDKDNYYNDNNKHSWESSSQMTFHVFTYDLYYLGVYNLIMGPDWQMYSLNCNR